MAITVGSRCPNACGNGKDSLLKEKFHSTGNTRMNGKKKEYEFKRILFCPKCLYEVNWDEKVWKDKPI